MRKLLFVLCLFIMCGCSSNKMIQVERIEKGYEDEIIASDLPKLYGGGYRYKKTDDGFEIESFAGDGTNKSDEIIRSVGNEDNTRSYYYVKDGQSTLLFKGKGEGPEYNIYPPYPGDFEMNNKLYFFYYDDDYLLVHEVHDGQLELVKKYPLVDGDYVYDGFSFNSYEYFAVYRSNEKIKYVFEEKEYVFDNTDRVIFMENYIFYSSFELAKPTGTYLINRKTNDKYRFEENIDLILDPLYKDLPNIYNAKIKENSIIFMESIDNQSYYTYGKIENDTFTMVQLPYVYRETDSIGLYDENTILFIKDNENYNLDFHVITIQ